METLNNLEIQILRILEGHQGRGNAIGRFALVDQVNAEIPPCPPFAKGGVGGFSERMIRMTIKHLVTQHGIAIGSCHWGYFMAGTPAEIEQVCKYYDGYGLSSLFVSAKLRKIEMKDYLGQLSLKYGG
jgi:hypothetical protein